MTAPPRDKEGYLVNLEDWSPSVAEATATLDGIILTPAHWAIIDLVRAFYQRTDTSPAMRPLVKLVRESLGAECGNSIYLMQLFPGSPAKRIARLAGLPRPTNCL